MLSSVPPHRERLALKEQWNFRVQNLPSLHARMAQHCFQQQALKSSARAFGTRFGAEVQYDEPVKKAAKKSVKSQTTNTTTASAATSTASATKTTSKKTKTKK